MAYNPRDYYFLKAKKENFAARSIYKLEEMDKRFRILRTGDRVLDLGAAPGSWSQYASNKVGPKGIVVGVDLQKIDLTLPNARFIQGNILELDVDQSFQQLQINHFDVLLSDMAPKTTGIRITDQTRSLELCEMALKISEKWLKTSGNFVCKLFHSEGFTQFRDQLKKQFNRVEVIRPQSTRKESKEIFFVAFEKK